MVVFTTTKEMRELAEYLEELDGVEEVEFNKATEDSERYVSAVVQLAGIDLWEIHDKFDVDVVSSWHGPTRDKINMCFRTHDSIE